MTFRRHGGVVFLTSPANVSSLCMPTLTVMYSAWVVFSRMVSRPSLMSPRCLILTLVRHGPPVCSLIALLPHAVNCIGLCLALSATFLFAYQIPWELLNGFAPNSHGRCVWSFAQTSLNVKFKGQGHQGVGQNSIFRPFWWPACGLCLVKHLRPLVCIILSYN